MTHFNHKCFWRGLQQWRHSAAFLTLSLRHYRVMLKAPMFLERLRYFTGATRAIRRQNPLGDIRTHSKSLKGLGQSLSHSKLILSQIPGFR